MTTELSTITQQLPNPAPCGVFCYPLKRGGYRRLRARAHTAAIISHDRSSHALYRQNRHPLRR
nr:MAG TPA: hypothetical protein [Caudoviricetes sp.]